MAVVWESEVRNGAMAVGDYRSGAEELLDLFGGPAWRADALCREYPKLSWFAQSDKSSAAAKAVCTRCLVRSECLAYALADPTLDGVWGGLTRQERRELHHPVPDADRLTA